MHPVDLPKKDTPQGQWIVKLIDVATDGQELNGVKPDWEKNMNVIDMIKASPILSCQAVQAIRQKLKSHNLDTVLLALNLLDSLTKNCGSTLLFIVQDDFIRTLTKLALDQRKATKAKLTNWRRKPASGEGYKKASVMEKSKLQIQALAESLASDPRFIKFGTVYHEMLDKGVRFPERTKDETGFIPIPPKGVNMLINPGLPTPVPPFSSAAQRPYYDAAHDIPTVGPFIETPFGVPQMQSADTTQFWRNKKFAPARMDAGEIKPKKRVEDLTDKVVINLQDVTFMLSDMQFTSDGSINSVELMGEVYSNLKQEKDKVERMVPSITDEKKLWKTLQVIDLANDVLADFKGLVDGTRKRGKVTPQGPAISEYKSEDDVPKSKAEEQVDLLGFLIESREQKEPVGEASQSENSDINEMPEGVSPKNKKTVEEKDAAFGFFSMPKEASRKKIEVPKAKPGPDLFSLSVGEANHPSQSHSPFQEKKDSSGPDPFEINMSPLDIFAQEEKPTIDDPFANIPPPSSITLEPDTGLFEQGKEPVGDPFALSIPLQADPFAPTAQKSEDPFAVNTPKTEFVNLTILDGKQNASLEDSIDPFASKPSASADADPFDVLSFSNPPGDLENPFAKGVKDDSNPSVNPTSQPVFGSSAAPAAFSSATVPFDNLLATANLSSDIDTFQRSSQQGNPFSGLTADFSTSSIGKKEVDPFADPFSSNAAGTQIGARSIGIGANPFDMLGRRGTSAKEPGNNSTQKDVSTFDPFAVFDQ